MSDPCRPVYTGRFAPSPTGELHLGSLATALASYLQARYHHGRWLIRIDDIDPQRERPGSAASIVATLEQFGLFPDAPVIYQSQRAALYHSAITQLLDQDLAYPCACSRADLDRNGRYPGHCRAGMPPGAQQRSLRVRCEQAQISFMDALAGAQHIHLQQHTGDFVIRRADACFAYQLCCAVDDAAPTITEVVRGMDLLDSTAQQIHIRRLLQLHSPRYAHIPVIVDEHGKKLSKRDQADPLLHGDHITAMRQALTHLQHPPPAAITSIDGLLTWALSHWQPARLSSAWA